jgi:predicted Zn-dependent protease
MIKSVTVQQNLFFILIGFIAIFLNACTINHRAPIQKGTIPADFNPTAEEIKYGQNLFTSLKKDFKLDNESDNYKRLISVFNNLAEVAEINPKSWQVYLFDKPDIVDIRAVHGNYLFAWSGLFSVLNSEDELAGLVACELSHDLASHTEPVKFNAFSELLFGVVDVATTVGVALLSQGIVAVSAPGLTRWAFVESTDLDPLDRVYSDEEVFDMASIALLILDRSKYGAGSLLTFWQRVQGDETLEKKVKPLIRKMPTEERVALLKAVMSELSQLKCIKAEQGTKNDDP